MGFDGSEAGGCGQQWYIEKFWLGSWHSGLKVLGFSLQVSFYDLEVVGFSLEVEVSGVEVAFVLIRKYSSKLWCGSGSCRLWSREEIFYKECRKGKT